ncbi:hypothetical protein AAHS21_30645 [Mycobacterium sp. 050272]|uniref:hypothetical protein n=1 Tax=Mycobacterium sp. 050272 TaxID=3142488 RepID=UPI00318701A5
MSPWFGCRPAVTPALSLQNDIVAPYLKTLANQEQQARRLPGYSLSAPGSLIATAPMISPVMEPELGQLLDDHGIGRQFFSALVQPARSIEL